jgi:hypothetical protein
MPPNFRAFIIVEVSKTEYRTECNSDVPICCKVNTRCLQCFMIRVTIVIFRQNVVSVSDNLQEQCCKLGLFGWHWNLNFGVISAGDDA